MSTVETGPDAPTAFLKDCVDVATDPAEIKEIGAKLDAFEQYMHDCGLYGIEDMRPINETRMVARWKLGRALTMTARGGEGGRPSSKKPTGLVRGFWTWTKEKLGLDPKTVVSTQRIGTLPDEVLRQIIESWRERPDLLTFLDLVDLARPYWYKANHLVSKLKDEVAFDTANVRSMERTFTHPKTGAPTTMRTGNIGKSKPDAADELPLWRGGGVQEGPLSRGQADIGPMPGDIGS